MKIFKKFQFHKKNTKGSHVGVVLSFTLFITFLVFTYAILGPVVIRDNERDNSLDKFEKRVIHDLEDNVYEIRYYDSSSPGSCIAFNKPENTFQNESFIVRDSLGTKLNSEISSGKLIVESGKGFLKGYFSDDLFKFTNSSMTSCTEVQYDSILNSTEITEKKILGLINQSLSNYTSLENSFGLNYEFDILFDYKNGTIIGGRKSNIREDVYARTLNIKYLDLEAKEKIGDLILKIW